MPNQHEALTPVRSFDWMSADRSTLANEAQIAMKLKDCPFPVHSLDVEIDPWFSNIHIDAALKSGIDAALNQVGDTYSSVEFQDHSGITFRADVNQTHAAVEAFKGNQLISIYERTFPSSNSENYQSFLDSLDQLKERYIDIFPTEPGEMLAQVKRTKDAVAIQLLFGSDTAEGTSIEKVIYENTDYEWSYEQSARMNQGVRTRYRVSSNSPARIISYLPTSELGMRTTSEDSVVSISHSVLGEHGVESLLVKSKPGKTLLNQEHQLLPLKQLMRARHRDIYSTAELRLHDTEITALYNGKPLESTTWGRLYAITKEGLSMVGKPELVCLFGVTEDTRGVGLLYDPFTQELQDIIEINPQHFLDPLEKSTRV